MRILRLKEVLQKTGLGKTNLYKKISLGEFPKSLPLGDRNVGWLESEIDAWILACISKRDSKA